jgi:hypothetical protein
MAHREQHGNREKRKPKKEKVKVAPVASPFSSVEAKQKAARHHGKKSA